MISSTYQVASNATGIAGTLIFSPLLLIESLPGCCTSTFNSVMFSPRILFSRLFFVMLKSTNKTSKEEANVSLESHSDLLKRTLVEFYISDIIFNMSILN